MAAEGGVVVETFMNNTLQTLAVEDRGGGRGSRGGRLVEVVELAAVVEDGI